MTRKTPDNLIIVVLSFSLGVAIFLLFQAHSALDERRRNLADSVQRLAKFSDKYHELANGSNVDGTSKLVDGFTERVTSLEAGRSKIEMDYFLVDIVALIGIIAANGFVIMIIWKSKSDHV